MKVNKGSGSTGMNSIRTGGGKDSERSREVSEVKEFEATAETDDTTVFDAIVRKHLDAVEGLELKKLLDEVDELGEALKRTGSLQVFARYKAAVAGILRKIVPELYEVVEKKHRRYVDNNKTYTIGQNINRKLQELSEELIKSQRDNLGILSKIDDIRGMILDIVIFEGKADGDG